MEGGRKSEEGREEGGWGGRSREEQTYTVHLGLIRRDSVKNQTVEYIIPKRDIMVLQENC